MELTLVTPDAAVKPLTPLQFPIPEDVIESMAKVLIENKGVGLAAPQVGIMQPFFITLVDKTLRVVCNPRIEVLSPKVFSHIEGCLTLPGFKTRVTRFYSIRLQAQDAMGKPFAWNCKDLYAAIIQHELQHLQGVLINGQIT